MYQPRRTLILLQRLEALLAKEGHAKESDVYEALDGLCVYLTDALQDPEFGFALRKLLESHHTHDVSADDFDRFLMREREILIVYGLPSALAEQAGNEFRVLRTIADPLPSLQEFIGTVGRLRRVICDEASRRAPKLSRLMRGIKEAALSLTGGAVVSADVLVALHLDGGLISGLSVERGLLMTYRHALAAIEVLAGPE